MSEPTKPAAQPPSVLKPEEMRLTSLLQRPEIKSRFEQVLGAKAPAFLSSIISAVNSNKALKEAEPMSVISAAAVAATLDLPINPSLGFAHIVPYKGVAQFQIGWKGYVQMALRTGQYKTINVVAIKEGQLKSHNPFTGEFEFHDAATSETIIGYLLYFRLLSGFEKYFYMSKAETLAHGKRYSASFKSGFGFWVENFDAASLKTVVKLGLSKYGILSIEMQKAMETDQAEIDETGEVKSYPDAIDAEPQPAAESPKKGSRMKQAVQATQDAQVKEPPVNGEAAAAVQQTFPGATTEPAI